MTKPLVGPLIFMINVSIIGQLSGMSLWNYFFAKAPGVDVLLSTHAYEALNNVIRAEVESGCLKRIVKIHAWVSDCLAATPGHPFLLYASAYSTLHTDGVGEKEQVVAIANLMECILQSRIFYEVISHDMQVWFAHELCALADLAKVMLTSSKSNPFVDALYSFSLLADNLLLYKDTQIDLLMHASKKLFLAHMPLAKKQINEVDAVVVKMNYLYCGIAHMGRVSWAEFARKYLPRLLEHLQGREWIPVALPSCEPWELVSHYGTSKEVDIPVD